jgi:TolA-binding protein
MNNHRKVLPWFPTLLPITFAMACSLLVWGCSSSQSDKRPVVQPSATDALRKEMFRLRQENDSLKLQIDKLQQENRLATAHSAQLETDNADLREKLKAIPPPPPPTPTAAITVPQTPRIADPNLAYQEGLKLFRARNYGEAQSTFQSVLDSNPGSLEDHCYYWIGECEFAQKNYQSGIEHFQKVFSFNRSSKKDDAQMMIANSYLAMGSKAKAREEYKKLIEKYPASPYVKSAKAKLSKITGD